MLVGSVQTGGRLETLESLRMPVRLGQDAFTTGRFSAQTIQMAVDAFMRFRTVAQQFDVGQTRAVATSAMRETTNGAALLERISSETGFQVEIISGEEEARLIHLAVRNAVDLHGKTALMIDIGGGSVEVLLSDGENILSTESFGLGTVRLLRNLDDPDMRGLPLHRLLRDYAASARRYIDQEIGDDRVDVCLGTGGNIEEMGRLRRRLLKRRRMDRISLDDLENLIERLGELSVEQRIEKLKLNPDRADVILPAAIVLQMIAHEARAKTILIPGVGLKDGLLLDMAPLALGPHLPRRVQVMASAERIGRKYGYDADHAAATARLAVSLFEQTYALHGMGENDCTLLEAAALLHNIGHYIHTIDHDKHGYYLLQHNPLIGLSSGEQGIVANVVRYHSKQDPSIEDENFRRLAPKDRNRVDMLCALLRLADALDISHLRRVQAVKLEPCDSGGWCLQLIGEGEVMLEKWALEKRKSLFEDVFDVRVGVMDVKDL
jgi:exopolyphosphatase/guanosine-5'-triphosphate,3'-diphosphate pyrophosphatase